jgi:lipoprotein-anchoring transpeptidase ErfK/SrfK
VARTGKVRREPSEVDMRAFFILLVLAAIGFVGWKWYSARQAAESATKTEQVAAADAAKAPAAGGQGFGGSDEQPAAIPPELKAMYDQAEALWAASSKDGGPATNAKAPLLDQLYSKVLQGIYNKPGQKALELRLVADRLTPLGNELFFSKTRYPDDETGVFVLHEAQPGESPDRIAKKYGMSIELLNRMRGMTNLQDASLHAGDRLKVATVRDHGGYFLHVDKGDFYLDCYVAGLFARRYPISHGAKETPTPVGKTHLIDRVLDPTWTDPHTHEVYQPEDPRNILGRVWMAFSPDGIGQSGLGIHGYTGPNPKMQAMVSNGCVRLDTPQAQELYQTICHPNRCPTAVEIVE